MQRVSSIMPRLRNLPATDSAPQAVDRATAQVVNDLFRELKAIFPAWKQAWPDDETLRAAKVSWIKAFMAQGIRDIHQIRYGVEQCRALESPFAPSIGEFIALCQPTPELCGLPSLDQAYDEAVRKAHPSMTGASWSHAAVYHAAAETGLTALATLPEQASRKKFEKHYQATVRSVMAGRPLRVIPVAAVEHNPPRTPKVGNDALASIRRMRAGGFQPLADHVHRD